MSWLLRDGLMDDMQSQRCIHGIRLLQTAGSLGFKMLPLNNLILLILY